MIADAFTYRAFALGWTIVRRTPERRANSLFRRMADQVWRRHGPSVQQYERNLRRVVPDAGDAEIRELSRLGLQSYARYWCEALSMPDWSRERILSFGMDGIEMIDDTLASGRGVVFVCPHAGNYDHGAAFLAQRWGSLVTVAERLRPDKLFDRFVAFRQELGMEVLGTGTPDLIPTLCDRIEQGKIVGLVGERDLSRRGVPVTFFDEPTRMPAGAAKVARSTGALVFPAAMFFSRAGAACRLLEPVDVPATDDEAGDIATATQRIADEFTASIPQYVTDWHMLQPLWVADLDPDRDPMRRAEAGR